MDRNFSLLLDGLRFMAAMLVFVYHAEFLLGEPALSPLASFGHDAVLFFFIISGFVIGYASSQKEKNLTDYAIARVSRIYSVAVPSLILVALLSSLGQALAPRHYTALPLGDWLEVSWKSLLFLNYSNTPFRPVPLNPPYWSLCYEFWFYVIFACFSYLDGKKRWLFAAAACLLAGPQILMLLPIWVAGLWVFRNTHRIAMPPRLAVGLLLAVITTYLFIRALNIDDRLAQWSWKSLATQGISTASLGWSRRFLPDHLVAALFLVGFCCLFSLRSVLAARLARFESQIKAVASYTFTFYLFHYPLLEFFRTVSSSSVIAVAATAVCVYVLGRAFEHNRVVLAHALRRRLNPSPVRPTI